MEPHFNLQPRRVLRFIFAAQFKLCGRCHEVEQKHGHAAAVDQEAEHHIAGHRVGGEGDIAEKAGDQDRAGWHLALIDLNQPLRRVLMLGQTE